MLTIYRSEASASLRRVPVWLVDSTGTNPVSAAGLQPQICWHARGTATVNTSGTLSLVSANAGLHHVELTASEVSALGVFSIQARSATAIAQTVFGKVVNYDSGDSVRFGQFALPNAAAEAVGGLITFGTSTGQIHTSSGSVGLKTQVHSGASVGVEDIKPGIYSAVSVSIRNGGIQVVSVGAGNYSGVSVEVKTKGIAQNSIETVNIYSSLTIQGLSNYANISNVTLAAGTHSNVTIKGIENYANISNVTLAAGTHSNVTIKGIENYANISNVTLAAGTHSNVTIQGVTLLNSNVTLRAGEHSGATIDGARFLSTAGERSAASSLLSTVIGGTRMVQQAIEVLRNRVQISGSTMTVFLADDTTSSWTATVSTGTATIYGIDPGIA